jgi:hypothetical protein
MAYRCKLSAVAISVGLVITPAHAEDQILTEVWSGTMRQIDAKNEKSYPMTVTLSGTTGISEYSSLSCGGRWTRIGEAFGHVIYSETITHGRYDENRGGGCIDGIVIVQRDTDALTLGWYITFSGQPSAATAILKPAAQK